ncbi:MAG: nucleoside phosphorylase [Clostridia bacterium]|nr:nucleoside phosphorylase [Clostridia bacterium]
MLVRQPYPILEHDDSKTAVLNPQAFVDKPFSCDKMIITFFPEVIDRLIEEKCIEPECHIGGENPFDVYHFVDTGELIVLGFVGCPACAGNLDLFHAMGVRKVMFCGGGGVLNKEIEVGQLLVVEGAIRDEGFSFHYIEPSRCIHTSEAVTAKIISYLNEHAIPYLRGLTWTTDAIFRETADRVAQRKAEGAMIVEMEQAGCIAVAQFRGFDYGALIYGGDDVSQQDWDNRSWRSRKGIRYDLVMLCKSLVSII